MPELPEVETVCRGLEEILQKTSVIADVVMHRPDIRFPFPQGLRKKLRHQPILSVTRRAKYILFELPDCFLLSHLGMTGSWRLLTSNEKLQAHDHFELCLQDKRRLVFQDPRRFGIIDWVAKSEQSQHPRLRHLGPEPFDDQTFHTTYLYKLSRKRNVILKNFIMDQKVVVGVGNIYASEALFRAGVRPSRRVNHVTLAEWQKTVSAIQEVLQEAIRSGGSSIRDYRQANGESGAFQERFFVYDRAAEKCRVCQTPIRHTTHAGRSTYWCHHCQK